MAHCAPFYPVVRAARTLTRSAIESIAKPFCSAERTSSLPTAIVPSGFVTSHRTPTSLRPARRISSIVASVWPFRPWSPSGWQRNGKICPGRTKSVASAVGATAALTVVVRSIAETPEEIPTLASIDTVNPVPYFDPFFSPSVEGPSDRPTLRS